MYFFEKGICSVQWGLGQSPRSWGIFENFCVKSTLHSERLLLTVSYRKNGVAGCTSCSPNNFVGEQFGGAVAELLPLLPQF